MARIEFSQLRNGTSFEGIACIHRVQILQTKNGKDYVLGYCCDGDKMTPFKIWDSAVTAQIKGITSSAAGFKPAIAYVTGNVGIYNGALDYTFTSVDMTSETVTISGLTVTDFLPTLDTAALYSELCTFINNNFSPNWINALMTIMDVHASEFTGNVPEATDTDKVLQRLKTAWAASSHHDAIGGGLMHHTLKMLKYAQVMISNDSWFDANKELVYAGIILHDIGKVQEIVDGTYVKNSFVTHRVMGIEYLAARKALIVSFIGIDNYYRLLSVIIGHHDNFGTPADTVWAYLVHLIDMLDTWATMVRMGAECGTYSTSSSGEHYLSSDGKRLYY